MKYVFKSAIAVGLSLAILGCTEAQPDQSEATEEAAQTQDVNTPAEPTEPIAFDIAAISCWDITTTEDDEQAFAATLLYGYHAGSTGTNEQTSDGIEAAIVRMVEFCVENPDANALDGLKSSPE